MEKSDIDNKSSIIELLANLTKEQQINIVVDLLKSYNLADIIKLIENLSSQNNKEATHITNNYYFNINIGKDDTNINEKSVIKQAFKKKEKKLKNK